MKHLQIVGSAAIIMQQQIFVFFIATIFLVNVQSQAPTCTETATCAYGFIPKKNCGKWSCYRDFPNIPVEWRGYWGVTHVCEWTWPGSSAVSIHCKEENDWTQAVFIYFFTGLYIPEGLPWAPWLFRWTDGTPVDFTDWAPAWHGSPYQQPANEHPIERVVDFTWHWHDTVSNNPVTNRILCKRAPEKIENVCSPPACPSNGAASIFIGSGVSLVLDNPGLGKADPVGTCGNSQNEILTSYNGNIPADWTTSNGNSAGKWDRTNCAAPCMCTNTACYVPQVDPTNPGDPQTNPLLYLYPHCATLTDCFIAAVFTSPGLLVNPANPADQYNAVDQYSISSDVNVPSYPRITRIGCNGCPVVN